MKILAGPVVWLPTVALAHGAPQSGPQVVHGAIHALPTLWLLALAVLIGLIWHRRMRS